MTRFGAIVSILSIWVCLISGPVSADEPVKSKKGSVAPKAAFLKPNHHFGEVFEGEVVKHDFVVENQGNAPLVIKSIRPD